MLSRTNIALDDKLVRPKRETVEAALQAFVRAPGHAAVLALRGNGGIAVRNANDCLIAASCIELDEPLLHHDRDFERIAGVEPRLRLMAG